MFTDVDDIEAEELIQQLEREAKIQISKYQTRREEQEQQEQQAQSIGIISSENCWIVRLKKLK